MASSNEILYIKGDKNVEVKKLDVTLGDILSMECSNQNITNKVKSLRLLRVPEKGQHRFVLFLSKNVPVSWKQALVLFHPDIDLLHASYAACVDSSVLENLGTVVTVSETHTFL